METLKTYWNSFVKLLTEYDAGKIADTVQKVDWLKAVTEPLTWFIALPILIYVIWKKKYRIILLAVSLVLFVVLLQYTLPPSGQSIPLPKLLEFIGGTMILIGVNLYFLIMRE